MKDSVKMVTLARRAEGKNTADRANCCPAVLCFLVSFLALLLVKFSPAESRKLAVIFPPGYSKEESFRRTAASGVYVTGNGSFGNIVHFRIPLETSRQDLLDRLYAAGALLVINPFGDIGCFSRTDRPATTESRD